MPEDNGSESDIVDVTATMQMERLRPSREAKQSASKSLFLFSPENVPRSDSDDCFLNKNDDQCFSGRTIVNKKFAQNDKDHSHSGCVSALESTLKTAWAVDTQGKSYTMDAKKERKNTRRGSPHVSETQIVTTRSDENEVVKNNSEELENSDQLRLVDVAILDGMDELSNVPASLGDFETKDATWLYNLANLHYHKWGLEMSWLFRQLFISFRNNLLSLIRKSVTPRAAQVFTAGRFSRRLRQIYSDLHVQSGYTFVFRLAINYLALLVVEVINVITDWISWSILRMLHVFSFSRTAMSMHVPPQNNTSFLKRAALMSTLCIVQSFRSLVSFSFQILRVAGVKYLVKRIAYAGYHVIDRLQTIIRGRREVDELRGHRLNVFDIIWKGFVSFSLALPFLWTGFCIEGSCRLLEKFSRVVGSMNRRLNKVSLPTAPTNWLARRPAAAIWILLTAMETVLDGMFFNYLNKQSSGLACAFLLGVACLWVLATMKYVFSAGRDLRAPGTGAESLKKFINVVTMLPKLSYMVRVLGSRGTKRNVTERKNKLRRSESERRLRVSTRAEYRRERRQRDNPENVETASKNDGGKNGSTNKSPTETQAGCVKASTKSFEHGSAEELVLTHFKPWETKTRAKDDSSDVLTVFGARERSLKTGWRETHKLQRIHIYYVLLPQILLYILAYMWIENYWNNSSEVVNFRSGFEIDLETRLAGKDRVPSHILNIGGAAYLAGTEIISAVFSPELLNEEAIKLRERLTLEGTPWSEGVTSEDSSQWLCSFNATKDSMAQEWSTVIRLWDEITKRTEKDDSAPSFEEWILILSGKAKDSSNDLAVRMNKLAKEIKFMGLYCTMLTLESVTWLLHTAMVWVDAMSITSSATVLPLEYEESFRGILTAMINPDLIGKVGPETEIFNEHGIGCGEGASVQIEAIAQDVSECFEKGYHVSSNEFELETGGSYSVFDQIRYRMCGAQSWALDLTDGHYYRTGPQKFRRRKTVHSPSIDPPRAQHHIKDVSVFLQDLASRSIEGVASIVISWQDRLQTMTQKFLQSDRADQIRAERGYGTLSDRLVENISLFPFHITEPLTVANIKLASYVMSITNMFHLTSAAILAIFRVTPAFACDLFKAVSNIGLSFSRSGLRRVSHSLKAVTNSWVPIALDILHTADSVLGPLTFPAKYIYTTSVRRVHPVYFLTPSPPITLTPSLLTFHLSPFPTLNHD